jgi:hypothetical protein
LAEPLRRADTDSDERTRRTLSAPWTAAGDNPGPHRRADGIEPHNQELDPMNKDTFRVVTRGADGQIRIRDYDSQEALLKRHCQVGVDDCSTDLELRGRPVFRGLIGPMPEGQNVVRYESPEVFETLTKDWSCAKAPRRRSRSPSSTM